METTSPWSPTFHLCFDVASSSALFFVFFVACCAAVAQSTVSTAVAKNVFAKNVSPILSKSDRFLDNLQSTCLLKWEILSFYSIVMQPTRAKMVSTFWEPRDPRNTTTLLGWRSTLVEELLSIPYMWCQTRATDPRIALASLAQQNLLFCLSIIFLVFNKL